MAAQQNTKTSSTQRTSQSRIWFYLRLTAIVLAVLAITGAGSFLLVANFFWFYVSVGLALSAAIIFFLSSWIILSSPSTSSLANISLLATQEKLPGGYKYAQLYDQLCVQLLKIERQRRNLTLEDIASELGVDLKTITRWERGVTTPSPHYQQKIIEFLKNPLEEQNVGQSTLSNEPKGHSIVKQSSSDHIFFVDERLPSVNEFYGRQRECRALLASVIRESSVSIVGPRHIGKTWLIEYLREAIFAALDEKVIIGYVNTALPDCSTVAGFVEEALNALGLQASSGLTPDLALLEKSLHELQTKGLVVLCIDNFDNFTRYDCFDRSFFEALRAIATRYLSLVTASQKPLIDLVSKSTHSSPFFNIFKQVELVPFNKEDASGFVRDKGRQAGFTAEEQEALLEYARDRTDQWFPLRLQLGGQLLLEAKRTDETHYPLDNLTYWRKFRQQLDQRYRQITK